MMANALIPESIQWGGYRPIEYFYGTHLREVFFSPD
jgi:hypothetical protein